MTGHDLPTPDDDDPADAIEQHKIRYNPTGRTKLEAAGGDQVRPTPTPRPKLEAAEGNRIRYNPTRSRDDDTDDL